MSETPDPAISDLMENAITPGRWAASVHQAATVAQRIRDEAVSGSRLLPPQSRCSTERSGSCRRSKKTGNPATPT